MSTLFSCRHVDMSTCRLVVSGSPRDIDKRRFIHGEEPITWTHFSFWIKCRHIYLLSTCWHVDMLSKFTFTHFNFWVKCRHIFWLSTCWHVDMLSKFTFTITSRSRMLHVLPMNIYADVLYPSANIVMQKRSKHCRLFRRIRLDDRG
jgi:hypothetical protein